MRGAVFCQDRPSGGLGETIKGKAAKVDSTYISSVGRCYLSTPPKYFKSAIFLKPSY